MTDLKQMIAEQQARRTELTEHQRAVWKLNQTYEDGNRALLEAMIEASGRKIGDVIKLTGGEEAKIYWFKLLGEELVASCHDRTKAGKWSNRPRRSIKIPVKIEE